MRCPAQRDEGEIEGGGEVLRFGVAIGWETAPQTLMQGTNQGKSTRLWIATLATSLLYAVAHPPWSWWPLALVAVAPVSAVLLDRRSPIPWPRAALAGALFGVAVTYLLVGPWSWLAAREFFADSPGMALAFTASLPLIASGIALHYALAFMLIARLSRFGSAMAVVGSAGIWAAAELARTSLGYGNPWGAFAAALLAFDDWLGDFGAGAPSADALALGGPAFVAFLAAVFGGTLGLAWTERGFTVARTRVLGTGGAVVLVGVVASTAVGEWGLFRDEAQIPRQPLLVAVVQPGGGKSQLWEAMGAAESFGRSVELTRRPETKGADLIVWPENALPFLLNANGDKRERLRELARERGAALLVGGSRSFLGREGQVQVFNSAFLFPADGGEPLVYDKRHLLPFVERVPWWASIFLASPWQGAFTAGQSGKGLAMDSERSAAITPELFLVKGWRIAPLLCFEVIYPSAVVSRVAAGADLLVNLSNDSWFDGGAGADQHFSLARLGAAQTHRPLVRAATTGVSALVAENGRVSQRLPSGGGAVALLEVVPPRRRSFFTSGGQRFVGLTLFVVVLAVACLPRRVFGARSVSD